MKREFLFALYQTPRGKLLQTMEANYLRRSITVSCKQQQVQVGGLGWENEFVDFSLYQNYLILDGKAMGDANALKVTAKAFNLPIQTESMDLVVLPHILEFDARRFQTLREVNRILKPGGELVMLNFNPFSLSVRFQFLWDRKLADSWRAHFITKARVLDWLKLMNFELLTTAEFGLDSYTIAHGKFEFCFASLFAMAYGVKAVKRQYTLIPLSATKQRRGNLAAIGLSLKSNLHRQDNHD
ncbi:type 11 methyltransferase [Methylomonas albis]|uniref:Methyltransferase domain-containing protein n=1 Tax=Methylomonas albis TaxID=1854563 RepID=A0ABR9D341_9GAMM|nr:methyltransferase domain-containing protein [Methylomonas albis]MBD9356678.1 methyltransferase domain-containing protein [Methylomonas albis]CAD6879822.1 type 11 methyltransferase [Methylomonas albis]